MTCSDKEHEYGLISVGGDGTYFFVNESVNFEEAELNALLEWTEKGITPQNTQLTF